ncbi:MAG: hypothetical protein AAB483_04165 [Patescibacteria group bacterium]
MKRSKVENQPLAPKPEAERRKDRRRFTEIEFRLASGESLSEIKEAYQRGNSINFTLGVNDLVFRSAYRQIHENFHSGEGPYVRGRFFKKKDESVGFEFLWKDAPNETEEREGYLQLIEQFGSEYAFKEALEEIIDYAMRPSM